MRVATALLIFLLALELLLHLVTGNMDVAPFLVHPGDGRCVGLRPGGVGHYTGWFKRIPEVKHRINSWGYRGPPHPPVREKSVRRIVVLGDSFTFGQGVADHQTMPAQLQKGLRKKGVAQVQVLNFGIPGLNLAEIVDQYRYFARRWVADLVLLVLFSNDLDAPLCDDIGSDLHGWSLRNIRVYRLVFGLYKLATHKSLSLAMGEKQLKYHLARLQSYVLADGASLAVLVLRDPLRNRQRFGALAHSLDLNWHYLGNKSYAKISGEYHLSVAGNQRLSEDVAGWLAPLLLSLELR